MKIIKSNNENSQLFKIANKEKKYSNDFHLLKNGSEIIEMPKSKLTASQAVVDGKYRLYVSSNTKELFSNTYNNNCEALILGDGGDFASINYHNGKFASTDHTLTIQYKKQNNLYMYYYWKKNIKNIDHCFQGTKLKNLKKPFFRDMNIGVHKSILQQEKIAKVLSQQEEQVNKIKTLIEKLEKRNQYYAERLLSGELRVREGADGGIEFYENEDWKEVKVGNKTKLIPCNWRFEKIHNYLIENKKSQLAAKAAIEKGLYPFYNCSKTQSLFIDQFNMEKPSILLSTGGVAAVHYPESTKYAYSSDVYSVCVKNIDEKFISYYLKNHVSEINSYFQGAAIKHLSKKQFKNMFIPIVSESEAKLINKSLDLLIKEKNKVEKLLQKEQKRFDWMSDALLSGEYQVVD